MSPDVVSFSIIEQTLAEQRDSGIKQTVYNTNFHTVEEISVKVPEIAHIPPDTQQPWILLSPWLDLITESQGVSDIEIHRIELPKPFLTQVLLASLVGIYMGRLLESDAEDLRGGFPKATTGGVLLRDLFAGGKRVFVRLDTCSLKDALAGKGPVGEVKEIWM